MFFFFFFFFFSHGIIRIEQFDFKNIEERIGLLVSIGEI